MHCIPKDRVTKFLLEKAEKKTKNVRHSTTLNDFPAPQPGFNYYEIRKATQGYFVDTYNYGKLRMDEWYQLKATVTVGL